MKRIYYLCGILFLGILTLSGVGCGGGDGDDNSNDTPELSSGDVVSFTLLQTTDVHHRALGAGASATYGTSNDSTVGGYARLATEINRIRRAKEGSGVPTLLVDSGDYLMGTIYDFSLSGVPIGLSFISIMEYDAITIGNHELDYGSGPLAGFYNAAIGTSGEGFDVPIVASNMITSSASSSDDDIEELIEDGYIVDTYVKTLPNGLKVGFVGLMGADAESCISQSAPLTFKNDLTDATEVAYIQAKVDYLRDTLGAHIVVALSHSGITDPGEGGQAGDDIALANAVTGIDIIASGHEHEKTESIITENETMIICAGDYGKNLAQLDVTVTIGTGVTDATLTNNAITSAITPDSHIEYMVGLIEDGINDAVTENGLPEVNEVIATTDSTNLGIPTVAEETGMGNLVADSLRFMNYAVEQGADSSATPVATVGVVAGGVIRGGFDAAQSISFADLYSILPLGMTMDPSQQDVLGYPLMKIYLTGQELENLAQFSAYVMASEDSAFIASLPATVTYYDGLSAAPGDAAYMTARLAEALYYQVLPALNNDYFMNVSGIQYSHAGSAGLYQVSEINLYNAADFTCAGAISGVGLVPPTAIDTSDTDTVYPVIIDLYALLMMHSETFSNVLTSLGIPVIARDEDGYPIFTDRDGNARLPDTTDYNDVVTLLNYRLDADPTAVGVQEVKEWQALYSFLTNALYSSELGTSVIPDAAYGSTAISTGDQSRVN
ncbi:MAG: bifunctional metallophosphatase/5'-nucleotidase [Gammaproteobacteria bacterium]|nr:MAG: bifunctional metallophosphatase/5'-nucleotidase [Gammaproteobacteria bacterium]